MAIKRRVVMTLVMALLTAAVTLFAVPLSAGGGAGEGDGTGGDAPREGVVRVGKVVLGDEGVTGSDMDVCFSAGFLTTLARVGEIEMHRALVRTSLESDGVFDYPFIVLAGQGGFVLDEDERERLKRYVERGGFVLASAGCSNAPWAESFVEVVEQVWGEDALTPVTRGHPILHTLYDIEHIDVRVGDPDRAIQAYEVDGAVRMVFSPVGLNDTDRAGGGCCCCGGSEIRNARLINANILAYALTH